MTPHIHIRNENRSYLGYEMGALLQSGTFFKKTQYFMHILSFYLIHKPHGEDLNA